MALMVESVEEKLEQQGNNRFQRRIDAQRGHVYNVEFCVQIAEVCVPSMRGWKNFDPNNLEGISS